MLTQVIFALTRTLDVRFEFVIGKSDIFRRSLGIEHHFLTQKKYFCGRPGELFFRHPVRRIISFGLSVQHLTLHPLSVH